MNQCEGEVLVEEVTEEVAHAVVGPAPVDEQEALQVAELGKGIVRGQHRLHALLSTDADTNVCRWGRAETVHTHPYRSKSPAYFHSNHSIRPAVHLHRIFQPYGVYMSQAPDHTIDR